SPHLTALDELGVFPPSDQPWLQAVLVSPLRERLTALSLGAYHPTAEVQALMDSGLLGRLRTLVFYGYQPWEVAAGPVLAAGATDRLNSLSWVMADLAGPALRELAASHPLKSLERLDFGNNNFTPDSLAALAEWLASDRLPRLTSLDLSYCRMREAEPAVLAACPGLARLRELDLTGCEIRNQGARALAASPHVAGLRILRLGSNGIQGPAARTLAESPYLGGLRVLELSGNRIPTSVEKVLHRRFGPGVVR
ncbi:MAG TPA: hypothetical protein VEL76_39795, partial [Gemmataceae bacterium]|nr:hypothetical protein [Gemmataceae bacterium]